MKTIMIADDDSAILALLSYTFESDGFKVSLVKNGLEALDLASKRDFDVILLDMMMPELSGLAVTEALRQRANYTPIIILTARDDDDLKITGINSGVDDYLDKTTPQREIVARANALIRRNQIYQKPGQVAESLDHYSFDGLEIDLKTKSAMLADDRIDLSKREFNLLVFLIQNRDQIVSREAILTEFWGETQDYETRVVDVTISNLRKKLHNQFIKTKRGFGYQFSEHHTKDIL
ncbi:MAG: response regulator transcription factor [Lactococcus raffinolactis]|jgi:two-component system alkaline phosphatase synthesis response regulator PhoP|nr:response regulator transcription factor [Lactococcus raffinolactis]MBP6300804.1 response regulator transcription factor [Lactococcus sp.]MBR2542140.1 response regulator transcription factor [Lactococcus sp.]MCH4162951.1 response regulator transcription factor [Lactococcus raffinolactis]MDG4960873.1 response regulator transcription factor [Lactococcus raffinolactis]MDN5495114.1 response regulator transcription factor [Lactococcus raffinolactis]